jgi:hypothetical protein
LEKDIIDGWSSTVFPALSCSCGHVCCYHCVKAFLLSSLRFKFVFLTFVIIFFCFGCLFF